MEERRRRFSTAQQINPDTLKVIKKAANRLESIADTKEEPDNKEQVYERKHSIQQTVTSKLGSLALFKDEDEDDISTAGGGASFISAYTTPGPKERATCAKKKANLGVMFGVYLPTIQHILGVTMFIRLFWVVGVAGVWHTMQVYERKHSIQQTVTSKLGSLALLKDEDEDDISTAGGGASFISAYTTPGPKERATCAKKKANLGVMFGVYLPTIQHILGVTMFIRLFWVVGVAGVWHTMLLLFLCCTCTLLTCISLSAVATNGVVEGGGAYFMISRNLGAEFGSAVGILFYLANTVATSMYLVGGVEVFLLYIYPSLTIGGEEVHSDTGMLGMMSNNYRIYGTLLLLIECVIVALGVRVIILN
uniref:Amino acid permease/ SLC12A domain-containing protein n=1 Tax=Meloidogyne incognita TaxID=6306 RepID=A0A914MR73_MELIC